MGSTIGREGYAKIHDSCYATAQYLASEIAKMGPFELIFEGDSQKGIPALAWKLKDSANEDGYNLYDLADRLRSRGWQVPAYSMPANREDLVVQRILVRYGVSYDLASLLIDDMKRALDHFKKHPVSYSLSEQEASGFNHG